MQEVETAAVVQVDPGLQLKCALPVAHLTQRTGARRTNGLSQGSEVGALQHRHVLAVPAATIGSTGGLGSGGAHREHDFYPALQMRSESLQLSLPDPCREKIERP